MFLNNLWFVIIAFLWVGYFVLEGFDFGVGALLRLVGKDEKGRRVLINTIGPIWDGNEVWVVSAGAATFAAFPEWYASMFSGFYLALLLILVCLIVRGVAFEYRGKGHSNQWRARWDVAILITSWLLALLWGVAFGNIVRGVQLGADHEYAGNFLDLLNPFALLMGLCTLALFIAHGAMYLALKTTEEVRGRARSIAVTVGALAVILMAVAVWWQFSIRGTGWSLAAGAAGVALLVVALLLTRIGRDLSAFGASTLAVSLFTVSWFLAIYPNVLPSTLNPAYSLNIENAASTPYTLTLMSWIALVFSPVFLGYQAWSYWIFRKRISVKHIPESPTELKYHMDDTDQDGTVGVSSERGRKK